MSFQIDQIDPFHPHFDSLVRKLNGYLKSVDGDDHEFYNQFNSSDDLDFAFVGYLERLPVTCAGLKSYGSDRYELKRMFTLPEKRRNGYSKMMLNHLVDFAKSNDKVALVLETGKRQAEAIALYESYGFTRVVNFGPYAGVENSCCFELEV